MKKVLLTLSIIAVFLSSCEEAKNENRDYHNRHIFSFAVDGSWQAFTGYELMPNGIIEKNKYIETAQGVTKTVLIANVPYPKDKFDGLHAEDAMNYRGSGIVKYNFKPLWNPMSPFAVGRFSYDAMGYNSNVEAFSASPSGIEKWTHTSEWYWAIWGVTLIIGLMHSFILEFFARIKVFASRDVQEVVFFLSLVLISIYGYWNGITVQITYLDKMHFTLMDLVHNAPMYVLTPIIVGYIARLGMYFMMREGEEDEKEQFSEVVQPAQ